MSTTMIFALSFFSGQTRVATHDTSLTPTIASILNTANVITICYQFQSCVPGMGIWNWFLKLLLHCFAILGIYSAVMMWGGITGDIHHYTGISAEHSPAINNQVIYVLTKLCHFLPTLGWQRYWSWGQLRSLQTSWTVKWGHSNCFGMHFPVKQNNCFWPEKG